MRGKAAACLLALAVPVWAAPAGAEPVTVLALGDSLTQGYGLPERDGFVPRLEAWLTARGEEVELINGGVSGETTAGGAARVDWSLTAEVDAMIVALGGNDLLRGIDPQVTRANLETILAAAAREDVEVLLVGMRVPGNYGPGYKAAFDAIYPELAATHGTLYVESFFSGLESSDPGEMRGYMQSDGLHPDADGVRRIVAAMGPVVRKLIAAAQP